MRRPRTRQTRGNDRPTPKAEEVANVRIEGIAAGGAGVGRIAGLTCFVPRTAIGDVAQVAYVNHGRYARGRVLQLLEHSSDRVEPRCAHYVKDACGGCQLQHLSGDAQRDARRLIVRDALQRVARREVPLPELVSGPEWGYRERLTLTLRQKGAAWIGGLVPITHTSGVFALEQCAIAHPLLVDVWHGLRSMLRGMPAIAAASAALASAPLRLSLRIERRDEDAEDAATRVSLVVIGGVRWPERESWAAHVGEALPSVGDIWWEPEGSVAVQLAGAPARDALAFAQVNRSIASQLRDYVLATVRGVGPSRVIDAYSGRGDLSVRLAESGIAVTAIESDASATARAAERLRAFPSVRVVTALVEEAIDDALASSASAAVVVLNPPRRGVDIRVTAALADAYDQGVRGIVYVSCDPATLARDVARLGRWRIAELRCFDMFPQTAHVETVCLLVPEDA